MVLRLRLAIRTDLGRRIVRAWSIVPAAVDERSIGALLQDKGFSGSRFAGEMAAAGIKVIIPPARAQRKKMPKTPQRLIARYRNRVETSFNADFRTATPTLDAIELFKP
jgi:hypothetical protein